MPLRGSASPPAILSPRYRRAAPPEGRCGLAATDDERAAATVFTAYLMEQADTVDEGGPLFPAGALHAAFLAGVRWWERPDG